MAEWRQCSESTFIDSDIAVGPTLRRQHTRFLWTFLNGLSVCPQRNANRHSLLPASKMYWLRVQTARNLNSFARAAPPSASAPFFCFQTPIAPGQ